jgi:Mrp family chromosome partitioning ATPase
MSEILHELASQFDTVILDAPPLLMVTDALAIAPRVDGVLLVIKPSITKRSALKNVLEQLRQVNAKVLGVVMNDVKISNSRYFYYQRYYYNRKYSKRYGYIEPGAEPSEKTEIAAVGNEAKGSSSWLRRIILKKRINNKDQ